MKHLKYESEKGKVGQENADSIKLNIENDAVRFGIFPFRFYPYLNLKNTSAAQRHLG